MMIDANSRVTIVDFGLAVQVAPGQELHDSCGTVPFAAPEARNGAESASRLGLETGLPRWFLLPQVSLKYTFCNHLNRGFFHQNTGKPPFTRQCSGVYCIRIPVPSGVMA